MPELFTDFYQTVTTTAITTTARPATFSVLATNADLATGDFAGILEPDTPNAERIMVTAVAANTYTFTNEAGSAPHTHPSGSIFQHVLTARSFKRPLADHVAAADPHVGYIRKSTFQAIGDLLVGIAGGLTRLARGADGYALVSDSAQPTGLRYQPLTVQSSTTPTITNGGTIATAGLTESRVLPAAPVTGVILEAGTIGGQEIWVVNESVAASTITFAVAATSNIAGGSLLVVPGQIAIQLVWDSVANRWYHDPQATAVVSSVGLTAPSEFTVTGSPITGSGTFAIAKANQSANTVYAGPASGSAAAPTFRAPVGADLPVMGASGSGHARGATPDTPSTTGTRKFLREDAAWQEPPTMVASGASHAPGYAPDTPATAGITKFLREDATWQEPTGTGGGGSSSSGIGGSGALVPIAVVGPLTVGQSDITFSGIPATGFRNLRLRMKVRCTAAVTNTTVGLQFNGDAGSSYSYDTLVDAGTAGLSRLTSNLDTKMLLSYLPAASGTANSAAVFDVPIMGYADALHKTVRISSAMEYSAAAQAQVVAMGVGVWRSITAVNSITITPTTGNFDVGSYACLYGEMDTAGALLTPQTNLLYEKTLTAASASIDTGMLSQAYRDLRIVIEGRGDNASTSVFGAIRFNGDTGANYDFLFNGSGGASNLAAQTSVTIARIAGATAPANTASQVVIDILEYANTFWHKNVLSAAGVKVGTTNTSFGYDPAAGYWRNAAAITSIQFILSAGNWTAGTVVRIYGLPVSAGGAAVGTGTRLRISANQSIASATPTLINWDTEDSDPDAKHFTSAAALTGTVSKTTGSTTLTGSGTAFLTELSLGQVISVPGTAAEARVVTGIASNTSITVNSPYANTASAQTATRVNSAVVFRERGFYASELNIYSAAISAGGVQAQFRLNGSTIVGQSDLSFVNASAGYALTIQREFQMWDYLEVIWTQSSGGAVNVLADERTHWSVSAHPTVLISPATMGGSGSSHAAGLAPDPGSSSGTSRFLREDGSWTTPGIATGVPLTNALSADVTTTTQNTFYDGPSLTLTPGSWLLWGSVHVQDTGGPTQFTAKLWDGSASILDSGQAAIYTASASEDISLSGYVTVVTTTTFKISVANASRAGGTIRATTASNPSGNTASTLMAVPVTTGVSGSGSSAGGGGGGSGALVPIMVVGPLSAAQSTISFGNIPQTGFRNLRMVGKLACNGTGAFQIVNMTFNGDTGNNYGYTQAGGTSGTVGAGRATAQAAGFVAYATASTALANSADSFVAEIPMYSDTTWKKTWISDGAGVLTAAVTGIERDMTAGQWEGTAAITSITLTPANGSFVAGSYVCLYGEMDTAGPLLTPASNLLYEKTLTSAQASIDTGTLSQAYRDLRIVFSGRGTTSAKYTELKIRFNGDTGNTSDWTRGETYTAAGGGGQFSSTADDGMLPMRFPAATAAASIFGSANYVVPNYTSTASYKSLTGTGSSPSSTAADMIVSTGQGEWRNTAAITSIQLLPEAGSFDVGTTVRIYGEPVSAGGSAVGTGTELHIASNQSISNGATAIIGWTSESSDADNQHFISSSNLTGTVSKAGTATLTGTGTAFLTELSVGQAISVPGGGTEKRVVIAIASNTSLTVSTPFAFTSSGQTAARLNSAIVFRQPGWYDLKAGISWANHATGYREVGLYLNDAATPFALDSRASIGNLFMSQNVAGARNFQQWDFVVVGVLQTSGGALDVTNDATTFFSVNARPTVIIAVPYVNIQDQKAAPSEGGTFTSGAWRTRTLNTIQSDATGLATLATNQITLPAGTYRCSISCPAYNVLSNVARLQNITDTATLVRGTMEYSGPTGGISNTRSFILGRFVLTKATILEVQHYCNTTKASFGFGVGATNGGATDGGIEVYTVAEFWKEG